MSSYGTFNNYNEYIRNLIQAELSREKPIDRDLLVLSIVGVAAILLQATNDIIILGAKFNDFQYKWIKILEIICKI